MPNGDWQQKIVRVYVPYGIYDKFNELKEQKLIHTIAGGLTLCIYFGLEPFFKQLENARIFQSNNKKVSFGTWSNDQYVFIKNKNGKFTKYKKVME